jgi:hypothetical protein
VNKPDADGGFVGLNDDRFPESGKPQKEQLMQENRQSKQQRYIFGAMLIGRSQTLVLGSEFSEGVG